MENRDKMGVFKKYNPEPSELDTLLKSYKLGIMSFDTNLLEKSKEKIKILLKNSSDVFSVFDKNELIGVCSIKKLEWDTDFFGYPCACIDFCFCSITGHKNKKEAYSLIINYIKKWLMSNKIKFCYTKIDKRDNELISSLENMGFKIIEEIASFYFDLKKNRNIIQPEGSFRMATPSDIPRLQEISPQSTSNRFAKDNMFSDEVVTKFRKEWIKNLVNGLSDFVILSLENKTISGFNACNIGKDTNTGKIQLIVVDKEYIGKGTGKRLVNKSIEEIKNRAADYLFVSTQSDNIPACNLYQRCGFKKAPPMVTLHYWG